MLSISGRSSRSTLMETKCLFMRAAVSSFSKDSRSMTWHQWQAEYPTLSRMGLSSCCAFCRASSPQEYQYKGLCACCNKYGLVSLMSRLLCLYWDVEFVVVLDMIPPVGDVLLLFSGFSC